MFRKIDIKDLQKENLFYQQLTENPNVNFDEYKPTENEILSQKDSKACSKFRGEACAADLFEEVGLEYEAQKKFPDTHLTFDFYLPQLNVVIESDGAQH